MDKKDNLTLSDDHRQAAKPKFRIGSAVFRVGLRLAARNPEKFRVNSVRRLQKHYQQDRR
jgi:hypothetical protein